MSAHHHKNNVGTTFKASVTDQDGNVITVAGGDTKRVLFKKPSGNTLTKTGSVIDGPSGIFGYTTIAGDMDEVGSWQVQGYLRNADGEWYGDVQKFKVLDNIA